MKTNLKYKISILLASFFISLCALSQQAEESRLITNVYPANAETSIEVSNKYGMMHVNTWAKDSVKIEISMVVRAKQVDKVKKMMNEVDFSFVNTPYYIVSKTIFSNTGRDMMNDFKGALLSTTDNSIRIDYTIWLPKKCNVKLENRFGDIYADDLEGIININLSYGSFKAHSLIGNVHLDLSFGDASIYEMNAARINFGYGELSIEKANSLTLLSKSARVSIEEVNKLKLDTRRDKYYINKVSNVEGNASFSSININTLTTLCNGTLSYGNIYFKELGEKLSEINLKSKYTDISLGLSKNNISSQCDITYTKTNVILPTTNIAIEKNVIDPKLQTFRSTGIVGTNVSTSSKITIVAEGGEIRFK